jgi:hypothetical protein
MKAISMVLLLGHTFAFVFGPCPPVGPNACLPHQTSSAPSALDTLTTLVTSTTSNPNIVFGYFGYFDYIIIISTHPLFNDSSQQHRRESTNYKDAFFSLHSHHRHHQDGYYLDNQVIVSREYAYNPLLLSSFFAWDIELFKVTAGWKMSHNCRKGYHWWS